MKRRGTKRRDKQPLGKVDSMELCNNGYVELLDIDSRHPALHHSFNNSLAGAEEE
jgi:hypothetical protein